MIAVLAMVLLVAFIHVDGRDFNAMLEGQDYARVYTVGESRRENDYLRLQDRARAEKRDLWGYQTAEPPSVSTPGS